MSVITGALAIAGYRGVGVKSVTSVAISITILATDWSIVVGTKFVFDGRGKLDTIGSIDLKTSLSLSIIFDGAKDYALNCNQAEGDHCKSKG